jgi:hypothetical protein
VAVIRLRPHGLRRDERGPLKIVVIAGLDPAIHSARPEFVLRRYGMDARIKSGHDDDWK